MDGEGVAQGDGKGGDDRSQDSRSAKLYSTSGEIESYSGLGVAFLSILGLAGAIVPVKETEEGK